MRKSRAGVGLQMALALIMPPKGKAVGGTTTPQPSEEANEDGLMSPDAPPYLTGRWDFSRLFGVDADPESVELAEESAEQVQHMAQNAWRMTMKADKNHAKQEQADSENTGESFKPKAMSHEEVRLWLQSFNAGPYALLKYEGDVPYQETQNYVPRVLKYYEQDLSSEYDPLIEAAAKKYGLDPQMIRAVMKTESNFRNDCVSHAGARGLLQVMPIVWKDIKEKYDLPWDYSTQVFEPEKNIEVACAYLAWLRYDFLPRHFAAFDRNPEAPSVLVRDFDRGVPDRESPRIIAKSDTSTPKEDALIVASTGNEVRKADEKAAGKSEVATDAGASGSESKQVASASKADKSESAKSDSKSKKASEAKSSGKAEVADAKASSKASDKDAEASRGKIEITDADSSKKGSRKVTSRGSGKAVAISVSKGGKVTTKSREDVEKTKRAALDRGSDKAVAKSSSEQESDVGG